MSNFDGVLRKLRMQRTRQAAALEETERNIEQLEELIESAQEKQTNQRQKTVGRKS